MSGGKMPSRKMKSKICLVGENAVGKTSLIKRFVLDIFDDSYITTIGTKVSKRSATLDVGGEKIDVDMMIWDIMGQSSFRSLLRDAYFHGANGTIAVCDVTRLETLKAIDDWVAEMRAVTGEIPLVILANKSDLKDQSRMTEAALSACAKKYETKFYYSSAKTGANVTEAFETMGKAALEQQLESGE